MGKSPLPTLMRVSKMAAMILAARASMLQNVCKKTLSGFKPSVITTYFGRQEFVAVWGQYHEF
jgi:hypothetical protein